MAAGLTTRRRNLYQGFSSTGDKFTEEFMELYGTRLKWSAAIGVLYVPILFYLEVSYAGVAEAHTSLWKLAGARGLLTLLMAVLWAWLHWGHPRLRSLTVADWLIFPSVSVTSIYLGTELYGIDSAYFCGIIMMNYMRAFFVPGGLRRALPLLFFNWLSMPLMLGAMSFFDPRVVEQLGDAARLSNVVLEFLLIFAASTLAGICAWLVDRLQRQEFRLRRIGRYEILRKLGEGGMGVVYLARHGILKRPMAIKLLASKGPLDDQARLRFEREALHTAQLNHPNTIQIFDFGVTDDGVLYYAMEYIEGLDLDRLVATTGPLSPPRIIYLMKQACLSLAHAHERGIIHRDVKPANCIVSGLTSHADLVKVLDFGLAKVMQGREVTGHEETLEMSRPNTVLGTPTYMSPEQCLGSEADQRSDVYSLGCVMYFLATGRPPFQQANWMKIMVDHASTDPIPPSEMVSGMPQDLEAVILRCLSKSPKDRFATVRQLYETLEHCADASAWQLEDATRWWNRYEEEEGLRELEADDGTPVAIGTTMHMASDAVRRGVSDLKTRATSPVSLDGE